MTLTEHPLNKCPRCSRFCHLVAVSGAWRYYCKNERHTRPFLDVRG